MDAVVPEQLWDVLYSRMIANFYCAQKAILVHHTSTCGKQIAEAAPTTRIAAELLRSPTLRVCEPSDALGNFRRPAPGTWGGLVEGCGTTGEHRRQWLEPATAALRAMLAELRARARATGDRLPHGRRLHPGAAARP